MAEPKEVKHISPVRKPNKVLGIPIDPIQLDNLYKRIDEDMEDYDEEV